MKKATRDDFYNDFFKGVAHRGLHDDTKIENGLNAFKNAIDNGFAFEFDIHLTKDNQLVVMHDSNLERTTNKKGIIEELTLNEINENYRLLDGEKVPTLLDVIALNNERSTMVIELKPYMNNGRELAKCANKLLENNIKDKKRATIISFDPNVLIHFGKTELKKGLLLTSSRKDGLIFMNHFDYLDVEDTLLEDKRIKKYHSKGHILNVWTIRDIELFKNMMNKVDAITFENINPIEIKDLYCL